MPANTSPIFTVTPKVNWAASSAFGTTSVPAVTSTAATSYDGTTSAVLIYTAGSNGAFIQKLVFESGGTNATNSVARVFINNGSTNATATNNILFMQYSLPQTTASNTTATSHIELPMMIQLPASYRIYVLLASSANLVGGWYVSVVGGDY